MKLPKGVTIHIGNKKYVGEIPDNLASDTMKKKFSKSSPDEPATKKPASSKKAVDGN